MVSTGRYSGRREGNESENNSRIGGEAVSKIFRQNRQNIYSIEPVNRIQEVSCDPVLDILRDAIDELVTRFGFTDTDAFVLLEQKMEEVRDKQELRCRVTTEYERRLQQGRRYMRTGNIQEFLR